MQSVNSSEVTDGNSKKSRIRALLDYKIISTRSLLRVVLILIAYITVNLLLSYIWLGLNHESESALILTPQFVLIILIIHLYFSYKLFLSINKATRFVSYVIQIIFVFVLLPYLLVSISAFNTARNNNFIDDAPHLFLEFMMENKLIGNSYNQLRFGPYIFRIVDGEIKAFNDSIFVNDWWRKIPLVGYYLELVSSKIIVEAHEQDYVLVRRYYPDSAYIKIFKYNKFEGKHLLLMSSEIPKTVASTPFYYPAFNNNGYYLDPLITQSSVGKQGIVVMNEKIIPVNRNLIQSALKSLSPEKPDEVSYFSPDRDFVRLEDENAYFIVKSEARNTRINISYNYILDKINSIEEITNSQNLVSTEIDYAKLPDLLESELIPYREILKEYFSTSDDISFLKTQRNTPIKELSFENNSKTKNYLFISSPSFSGTGGSSGVILEINQTSRNGRVVGDYFGFAIASYGFSPSDKYLMFTSSNENGSDCIESITKVIDTEKDSDNVVIIDPNIDLSKYTPYINKDTGGRWEPSTTINEAVWLDDEKIQFVAEIATCSFLDDRGVLASSTWQYNVKTGEYKLLK